MTDDESLVAPDTRANADHLLYDYFKWLTTLSLLTLGGVLSLSQSAELRLSDRSILLVLVPLCAAGIAAWSGADGVVRAASGGKPPRLKASHSIRIATAALGVGVGVFLSLFWDVLK